MPIHQRNFDPNADFIAVSDFLARHYRPGNRDGNWLQPVNEPAATDPDYRRRGLARAAVLEGIRRCGQLGADVAHVNSVKPFYRSLGFRKQFTAN